MSSTRRATHFQKRPKVHAGKNTEFGSGNGGPNYNRKMKTIAAGTLLSTEATAADEKIERSKIANEIDEQMGFVRFESGGKKEGWLVNMQPTTIESGNGDFLAGMDYYFLDGVGGSFKATLLYDPYFLIAVKPGMEGEVEEWSRRKFEGLIKKTSRVLKEDLSMPNHLLGYRRTFIKLEFMNVNDLMAVKKVLLPIAAHNKKNVAILDAYAEVEGSSSTFDFLEDAYDSRKPTNIGDPSESIIDIREYDVPYHVRVSIDKDIRIGKWYTVEAKHGVIKIDCIVDRLARPDPVVLAFDIETTKLPLKFPDPLIDQIMMISYMIDGQGFLITNREVISEDIGDFEYTPKPEYKGEFMIFNEPNERALLERFYEHFKGAMPSVVVTYNGDFFDWPFVEARSSFLGIDMYKEIGFKKDQEDIYKSNYCVHMDAFSWVKRDSYLPQGSQGLKAVTVAKLGYDPDELDPELMTRYAAEKPQVLAEYSVSDAVATYYLYMKYVHPFVFSLCTIIPLNADDVLRKGTGTLCEMLLMVQAYEKGIVLPNKHKGAVETFYEGHLVESETYVGGHVESIEAGVFRSDIPTNFAIDTGAIDKLIGELDAALKFSIVVEGGKKLEDVTNYEEVKAKIQSRLQQLKDVPNRHECPSIYHLDVASMYPNIMTTNRLQPDSMISESDCAACDFNRPGKNCDRRLPWAWRGEYLPPDRRDYNMIKNSLMTEEFPPKYPNKPMRKWDDLAPDEQLTMVKKRLTEYSRKIYNRIHDSKTIEKEAIICQRENPFYVDTVKDFRDRRYDFKGKQKVWKGKTDNLVKAGAPQNEVDEAKKMIVLFDSLQLAHKVILNSFYGYVMRKGSRWYSMEMAGVTCLTGAHIIQMAKEIVERVGRPLELDTDGIWCILPKTFPENFAFTLTGGKKFPISYPCVMLNHLVHEKFTNHQYQELVDPVTHRYETHSENTIFFEVDGPYKAMILPTSKEEDKNLKKRYAVFNEDGSLAELKGFEVKRRGELKLIKIFQTQIFKFFLEGTSLQECYDAVAKPCNQWLDVLHSHGRTLADSELIELISENRSMSKTLEEYGKQKSTSITTAKRLAEFLGEQMVKDKGLACKFIISARPRSAPKVRNPVPRVQHPDWLQRRINIKDDKFKQKKMTDMFTKKDESLLAGTQNEDIEDFGRSLKIKPLVAQTTRMTLGKRKSPPVAKEQVPEDPYATLPEDMPPMRKDYGSWLQYQKKKWKIQKNARERRRHYFGDQPSMSKDGLGGYFRGRAEQMFIREWQVLQLRPSDIPGEVKAFVLIDKKVHSLKINVPRQLFMNLKDKELPDIEVPGCSAEKVTHTLPNGHPSVHLFKLTMSEDVYVTQSAKISQLLCHPSVEGVYETQLPLMMRALLELGGICTFDTDQQGVLGKGLEQGFDLSTLRRTTLLRPYLHDSGLQYLYLYHVVSGDRQILGFFSTAKQEAYVVVYHSAREATQLPNMDKIYADNYARRVNEDDNGKWQGSIEYQKSIHFTVTSVNTRMKLQKEANEIIKKLRTDESHPTIAVVQSPRRCVLLDTIPALNDFPILPIQVNPSDSTLPLAWQSYIAKRIVHVYLDLGGWLSHFLALSRYSDIPLCNLERGDIRFLIDVTYARRLQADNVVLWWSPTTKPDHGGYEHDDILNSMETAEIPVINNPGSYSSVCIDIDIRNLAINTILTSSIINELEGSDSVSLNPAAPVDGDTNGASTILFSENAFATAGIKVLREMVKAWWTEADKGNTMADIMVQHLVRWVESPDSYLYDRALHFYVQTMSKKAFLQLLTDFRRVGSNVVFANANRLIVQTSKSDIGNAYAYGNYILKAIKARPLFHFLDLDITEYWNYLVWYDDVNHGGKACQEVVEAPTQNLQTIMHWQMKSFLPKPLQPIFLDWVSEFVEILHSQKKRLQATDDFGSTPRPTQLPVKILSKASKDNDDDPDRPPVLGKEFTKPLRKQLTQIIRRQQQELLHPASTASSTSIYNFPTLPGGIKPLRNPALQLIKSLTLIFGLCKDLNLEARVIRKDLLTLLDIKEFAREGVFENPSASLKLGQIVCPECTVSRDLDLCKDESLMPLIPDSDDQGSANNDNTNGDTPPAKIQRPWKCTSPECNHEFDKLQIEERLIADIQRVITRYNVQDLKCAKCGTLKANEFLEHCVCSGNWVNTVEKEPIVTACRVYESVAKFYEFEMLRPVVEGVLAMMV
ncbi:DUF1744-domain-containing protein [Ascodesmis nigricans]|uniref:DNA polymerase epsilon catalytic subunit n=1 Tax=Ascodesmis nigricans TaxID=341454 RepID=A0A4S2MUI1_9PEZI|nr:DUF1744-domain-containing protein [Ascodesmis nigricans]